MKPLDTHNHLKGWSDGRQTAEDLLERAAEAGVRAGTSDHAGITDFLNTSDRLAEYAAFLANYPLARGFEMDLDRAFQVDPQVRRKFDYAIGGVHGVPMKGKRIGLSRTFNAMQGKETGYDPRAELPDMDAFFKAHLALLESEFDRQRYDILAHCNMLPPLVLGEPEEVFPPWWEDALVELLKTQNVRVELSNRWKTPYGRLLKKCVEAGLSFSMGSDGHDPVRSCHLEYPLEMAEKYAIPADRLLDIARDI